METNPAEYVLDLIITEIVHDGDDVIARIEHIHDAWNQSDEAHIIKQDIENAMLSAKDHTTAGPNIKKMNFAQQSAYMVPLILLHQSWIKSYRDVVAYIIRIVMYLGLAVLMGTVFLRLNNKQIEIRPYINAIFFGSAFMSFKAVAYVPAFLENRPHSPKNVQIDCVAC